MIIKRLPLLLILLLSSLYAEAQRSVLDDFELTSSEVEMLSPYSGQSLTDSNYVSYLFQSLVLEKLASADNQNRTWHVSENLQILQHASTDSRIPISIAAYKYTTVNNLRLIRPPLRQRHNLVMSCPVRIISRSSSVTFTFNVTEYSNLTISSLQFDPGDGLGYRTVSVNDSLSVYYSDGGAKELKTKITSGNRTLYSHSQFCVLPSEPHQIAPFSLPTDSQIIDTTLSRGVRVSAHINTYLADSHSQLTKPFFVAEGFDPVCLSQLLDSTNVEGFNTADYYKTHVWDSLTTLKNEYDLVYINWDNSEEDIQYNAALLQKIIRESNNEKHSNGSSEKGVLMGVSMGGLIGRIALHNMEESSKRHEIETFICHDTPNKGANVPVSIQRAWHLVNDYLETPSILEYIDTGSIPWKIKAIINKYMNCKAARQMSYYYVGSNGISSNLDHDDFYNNHLTLLPLGDGDEKITNIVLSNSGGFNYSDYLTPQGRYMDININVSATALQALYQGSSVNSFFEVLMFTYSTIFGPHFNIGLYSNVNDGFSNTASELNVSASVAWFVPLSQFNCNRSFSFNGEYNYDTSPNGSYYSIPKDLNTMIDSLPPYLGDNINWANQIMFIPKESSLDGNESTTPFDAYCCPANAQYHTELDYNGAAWLERQVTGLSITGPSTAQYGDQYTASGFPSTVTWSTSNPSVAGIDPSSGVIYPVSPGTVDVIATCIVNGREKYYKAKTVTVTGTPPVAIRIGAELIDGISYLYAELYSPDSAYNEYLNDENGDLDFHWIYKVDYLTVEHRYSRRVYLYGWENCGYEFFFLGVTVTDTVHNTQSYYSKAFPTSAYLTLETPKFVVITSAGTYVVSNDNQISAYDSDSPLIISCSPGFTSGVLTDQMTLVMENGEEYDAMRTNDTWSYYIFEDDELLDNVIDSMGTLEEGKSCCVLMKLVTSDDLPYKQLYIPFFYSNTFLNNQ